jgi:hypothetical protein
MTYEELKQKFQSKTIGKGWFLLKSEYAIEFINNGLNNNLKLEVVEGFLRSPEGAFEPRQEYSSDQFIGFEESEYNKKTIELIKTSANVPNLFFEVWMGDSTSSLSKL